MIGIIVEIAGGILSVVVSFYRKNDPNSPLFLRRYNKTLLFWLGLALISAGIFDFLRQ